MRSSPAVKLGSSAFDRNSLRVLPVELADRNAIDARASCRHSWGTESSEWQLDLCRSQLAWVIAKIERRAPVRFTNASLFTRCPLRAGVIRPKK
jgi:hypothetical protein